MNKYAISSEFRKICVQKDNHKRLIMLLSDNSEVAITVYGCFIKNKDVVMLLNQNTELRVIEQYMNQYEPDIICMTCDQYLEMIAYRPLQKLIKKFYEFSMEYSHFLFYDRKFISEGELLSQEFALLLPTSGSTGVGKMVALSYQNLRSNAQSIIEALNIQAGDNGALMLPMTYAYGLSVVNSYLMADGNIILPSGSMFEKKYWDYLEENQVNSFCGVPYTYEIMKRLKIFEREWKDLQLITQAGGALDINMKRYLLDWVKEHSEKYQKTHLAIMYGQTEATARMSTFFLDDYPEKIDSVGRAIPGGEFFLDGKDDFGEIFYKGPNVCLGYVNSRNDLLYDSCFAYQHRDYLKTGDVGKIDEDGFLFITGRKSRFVKIRGFRIGLDELEQKVSDILNKKVVCLLQYEQEIINIFLCDLIDDDVKMINQLCDRKGIPQNHYKIIKIQKFLYFDNGKMNYRAMQETYIKE